jgi:hypothetical protein
MECNPIPSAGLDMGIEAVVGNVGFATEKPLGKGLLPIECFSKGLKPVQVFASLLLPEHLCVRNRLIVERLISRHRPDHSILRKFATGREDPRFVHHVGDLLGGFGFRTVLRSHRISQIDTGVPKLGANGEASSGMG